MTSQMKTIIKDKDDFPFVKDRVLKNNNSVKRRNNLEIAPRALLLAVTVILSVLLISLMLSQFNSARDMANISSELISKRTEEIKERDIMQFDGMTVTGADVVNFCRSCLKDAVNGYQADYKIILKGSGVSRTYRNYETVLKLSDKEDSEYVNPVTRWKCSVKRNDNGIITEIMFSKE